MFSCIYVNVKYNLKYVTFHGHEKTHVKKIHVDSYKMEVIIKKGEK